MELMDPPGRVRRIDKAHMHKIFLRMLSLLLSLLNGHDKLLILSLVMHMTVKASTGMLTSASKGTRQLLFAVTLDFYPNKQVHVRIAKPVTRHTDRW